MSPALNSRNIIYWMFYSAALAVVLAIFHYFMSSETVGKVLVWVASLFTIVSFTSTLLLRTIADAGSAFNGTSEETRRRVEARLGTVRSKVVTQILKVITLILAAVLLGFYMQDRDQTRWMQKLPFISWVTIARVVFFESVPSWILVHAVVEIYSLFVTYDEAEKSRGRLGTEVERISKQQSEGLNKVGVGVDKNPDR